jgi:MSHA pilin protein MshD
MNLKLSHMILRTRGFTLIELVVAIVILSIGATALIVFIGQSTRRSIDPAVIQQANSIAQSYLEEVMLNPFCDPDLTNDCPAFCSGGPTCTACTTVPESSRSLFDDVCDYDGLNDLEAIDRSSNTITGLEEYNISISVDDGSDGSAAVLNTLSSATNQVLRVDVNVTHETLPDINFTVSGYRTNF